MASGSLRLPFQAILAAALLIPGPLPLQAQRPTPPPSNPPGPPPSFERPSSGATLHMDRPRPGGEGVGRGVMDRPGPVERPRGGGERSPEAGSGRGTRPGERTSPADRARPLPERTTVIRTRDLLPTPRCVERPTEAFWRSRDLLAEIQRNARRGNIPIIRVADDVNDLKGFGLFPAGWQGYGFLVPAGESLKVSLFHPNRGWFRLQMVNKWGTLEEGMIRNVIHTFDPVVTYTNPTRKARAVYVIADDPGWMSYEQNPFTLKIERSWDPAKVKLDDTPVVQGIWTASAEDPNRPDSEREGEGKKG